MNKPRVGKPKTLNVVSLSRNLPRLNAALGLPKTSAPGTAVAGRRHPVIGPPPSRKK